MTKYITLSRGLESIVDDEFYDELNKHKWHASSHKNHQYAIRHPFRGANIQMHREVMRLAGMVCLHFVDHINGDSLDNRLVNLRFATAGENARNSRKCSNNTSGYKGVSWNKRDRRWQVHIRHCGKQVHIGYFKDPTNAAIAYDTAAIKYHGEYARINFPNANICTQAG